MTESIQVVPPDDPDEKARLAEITEQVKRLEAEALGIRQRTWEPAYKDGLIFSSTSRCRKCGSGLCYPQDPKIQRNRDDDLAGTWWCMDAYFALLAKDKTFPYREHACFPFTFYEIKSEEQPSACGSTTRPAAGPHSKAEVTR